MRLDPVAAVTRIEVRDPMELLTSRLRLRTPSAADVPGYMGYRNEPAALLIQAKERMTWDEAEAFLETQSTLADDATGWRMFVVERHDRPDLLGEVGVYRHADDRRSGDVGWWLRSDQQGFGYATEAALALIAWLFGECDLHGVTATCRGANERSQAVMRRLGMKRVLPAGHGTGGDDREAESLVYTMDRQDWVRLYDGPAAGAPLL